jgi:phage tail sheath protein FI
VTVYGQKTLSKKPSALDRVNVRRLLIELKSYIGQFANTLVFEQNNQVTRDRFLTTVNSYLNQVQLQQGLDDFDVIMDETNNTPDVIDNNQLVGQVYIKPTRSAEFILLEFNILPSSATLGGQ